MKELKETAPELENATFSESEEQLLRQYGVEDLFKNNTTEHSVPNTNDVNMIVKKNKKNIYLFLD